MEKRKPVHKKKNSLMTSIGYLLVYLMVGVIPHIYKYVIFSVSESERAYLRDPFYADLYLLAKSRVFLVMTVFLLGVFLYQLYKKEVVLIRDKVTVGTGVFGIVILLSSVMSTYQDIVYWGVQDRFEGMWVWLSYLVVFTVVRHYGVNKDFVNQTLRIFIYSASLMAVFGIMQVFGYDIYTEGFIRWLAYPKEIASDMATYMIKNVTEAGAIGALFNSNYFGVYAGLAGLISIGYTFLAEDKNQLFLCLSVLLYGAMIASKSEAALLGFAVAIFCFMFAKGKEVLLKKNYLGVLVILAIVMDRYLAANLLYGQSGNALWIYLLLIVGVVAGLVLNASIRRGKFDQSLIKKHSLLLSVVSIVVFVATLHIGVGVIGTNNTHGSYSAISFNENILMLENKDKTSVGIEFLPNGLNVYDSQLNPYEPVAADGNILSYIIEGIQYSFEVRNYENGVVLSFKLPKGLNVFYDGQVIRYVNPAMGISQIEMPERMDYYFEHGSAFTNRAYLWSTYLPITMNHLLFGQGVDTYLPGFPQNDYFGKTMFYPEGDTILVDKPHSLYIDVLFGTGIVGFLVLGAYVITVVKHYFTCLALGNEESMYRLLPLLASIMLIVSGVFNDSVIPITILMSCLGGMGLISNEEI